MPKRTKKLQSPDHLENEYYTLYHYTFTCSCRCSATLTHMYLYSSSCAISTTGAFYQQWPLFIYHENSIFCPKSYHLVSKQLSSNRMKKWRTNGEEKWKSIFEMWTIFRFELKSCFFHNTSKFNKKMIETIKFDKWRERRENEGAVYPHRAVCKLIYSKRGESQ